MSPPSPNDLLTQGFARQSNGVPAYESVRLHLDGLIRTGTVPEGARFPAEPELACAFGVSRVTLSRALNSLVNEGLLVRRRGAGTFVRFSGKPIDPSPLVTILIHEGLDHAFLDHYFGGLIIGIQSHLGRQGFPVSQRQIDPAHLDCAALDGPVVLINPTLATARAIESTLDPALPLVVVGSRWPLHRAVSVDTDNVLGALLAVDHLARLGHQRIAFVGACPADANTVDRVRGFQTALRQIGATHWLDKTLLAQDATVFTLQEAANVAELLTADPAPTAVVCGGANIALHLVNIARSLEIRVPEDLSVVAFDDPSFLSLLTPPVTTVRQPLVQMAAAAAEALTLALKGQQPADRVFSPELVLRQSTTLPQKELCI